MATQSFIMAVGRRKNAIANIRLTKAEKRSLTVNGKSPREYFKTDERAHTALSAFDVAEAAETYAAIVNVSGGGVSAQADAVRLGIARALTKVEPKTRAVLKKASLLTRDARKKERKKPGLKKARKAPQWSKR